MPAFWMYPAEMLRRRALSPSHVSALTRQNKPCEGSYALPVTQRSRERQAKQRLRRFPPPARGLPLLQGCAAVASKPQDRAGTTRSREVQTRASLFQAEKLAGLGGFRKPGREQLIDARPLGAAEALISELIVDFRSWFRARFSVLQSPPPWRLGAFGSGSFLMQSDHSSIRLRAARDDVENGSTCFMTCAITIAWLFFVCAIHRKNLRKVHSDLSPPLRDFRSNSSHINHIRAEPQRAGQSAWRARGEDHVEIRRDRQRLQHGFRALRRVDHRQVAEKIFQVHAAAVF